MNSERDHGGAIDRAIAEFGGSPEDWIDLSTGINPNAYPLPQITPKAWGSLPDRYSIDGLEQAASRFWNVPSDLEVVAAGGASALIAALPHVVEGSSVQIPSPTYNEHRAAFEANCWKMSNDRADAIVVVHPNNPNGRLWTAAELTAKTAIIDESFCDVAPNSSFLQCYSASGVVLEKSSATDCYNENPPSTRIILKSFGKFWGLAGLRLGFAIAPPPIARHFRDQLGPWAVSGPACEIGTKALQDTEWANNTRADLHAAARRLDALLLEAGLTIEGGTDLFRLASTNDAAASFVHFANNHILTRIFPYSKTWVRFGLPGTEDQWERLHDALTTL